MNNALVRFILLALVPCSHKRQSWPMRLPGENGAHRTCLECGRRRPYSLLDANNVAVPGTSGNNHPTAAGARVLRHPQPVRLVGSGSD